MLGFLRALITNDFRASGSGNIIYNFEEIPISMIKIAFSVCDKLCLQSVAFDFVLKDGIPLNVEMSYGPYGWMVEELLKNG